MNIYTHPNQPVTIENKFNFSIWQMVKYGYGFSLGVTLWIAQLVFISNITKNIWPK